MLVSTAATLRKLAGGEPPVSDNMNTDVSHNTSLLNRNSCMCPVTPQEVLKGLNTIFAAGSQLCDRFRVLIMGRRNAGKTTILEKITDSEVGAKPEIRDKEGRLVVWGSVIYLINSQADDFRTTQHLSRQDWRSVNRRLHCSPTPLTNIPAWDEHDRLRDNIPEYPTLCLS